MRENRMSGGDGADVVADNVEVRECVGKGVCESRVTATDVTEWISAEVMSHRVSPLSEKEGELSISIAEVSYGIEQLIAQAVFCKTTGSTCTAANKTFLG